MVRWKIGTEIFDLTRRGWIMGVLNVTPDSFSDGGRYFDHAAALAQARAMLREGANIIDVGGESTRPGAVSVGAAEEIDRILPVIEELAHESKALISVDTSKAEVAAAALAAGAKIVNDITGGSDAAMWSLLKETGAAFVSMHIQGTPRTMQLAPHYDDVVRQVADSFRQQFERALACGIDAMTLAFDPGIGFGKTPAHNLSLLKNLDRLRVQDRPIVVGVSRKSFLGQWSSGSAATDRLFPTVGFTSLLRTQGADVVRVHDVMANVEALRVADAWRQA
jgi:dihydropteroate synthase